MGVGGRDERSCRPVRKISKKLKRESDRALQRQNNPVSLQGCGNLDHVVLRPNEACKDLMCPGYAEKLTCVLWSVGMSFTA